MSIYKIILKLYKLYKLYNYINYINYINYFSNIDIYIYNIEIS